MYGPCGGVLKVHVLDKNVATAEHTNHLRSAARNLCEFGLLIRGERTEFVFLRIGILKAPPPDLAPTINCSASGNGNVLCVLGVDERSHRTIAIAVAPNVFGRGVVIRGFATKNHRACFNIQSDVAF